MLQEAAFKVSYPSMMYNAYSFSSINVKETRVRISYRHHVTMQGPVNRTAVVNVSNDECVDLVFSRLLAVLLHIDTNSEG